MDKMSYRNPIVAFEHVLGNEWGAGIVPIWKYGTKFKEGWSKMAT